MPTGSSTQGLPSRWAHIAASCMASIQLGDRVPILIDSAALMAEISWISCCACAISGEAPMASRVLAVGVIAT